MLLLYYSVFGRYTRLASCDIWGTKEVDFLGLDDFSSPYQDEEVVSRTPTLAQLNSEDSLPVCETLYPPIDLNLPAPQAQTPQLPSHSKRLLVPNQGFGSMWPSPSASSRPSYSRPPDFPEGSQKATRPVPSCTETMAKAQNYLSLTQDHSQTQSKSVGRGTKMAAPGSLGIDFVRKAKVRVSSVYRAPADLPSQTDFKGSDPPLAHCQPEEEKASTSTLVGLTAATASSSPSMAGFEKKTEGVVKREIPGGCPASLPQLVEANQALKSSNSGPTSLEDVTGASSESGVLGVADPEQGKEEEHNYSLFLTRSGLTGRSHSQLEEDEDEEDEDEGEEDEGDGLELDDEDHDEGFGSEHELSENDEEEEEEDEDYEADKDDDMSDAFSEPGLLLVENFFFDRFPSMFPLSSSNFRSFLISSPRL